MHAKKIAKIRRSFVLSSAHIARICEVLADHSGTCEFEVKCVGDLTFSPASIEDLLTLSNVGTNKVRTLVLGRGWRSPSSEVRFSLDWGPPIEISVSGESDQVVQTFERLENAISLSLKHPWPAVLEVFIDGEPRQFSFILSLIFLSLPLGILIGRTVASPGHKLFILDPTTILLTSWVLLAALAPFLGHFACTKVFPKGIFLIGAGDEEYSDAKSRRQLFSPLFIAVTIILGVVGAWLAHFFGL